MFRAALRRIIGTPAPPAGGGDIDVAAIEAALQAADTERARALIEALPATAWNAAWAHGLQGRLLLLSDSAERAVESFETALLLDPDELQALVSLGGIRRARGEAGAASRLWRRASQLAPAMPGLRYNLACALAEAGDLDAAIVEAQVAWDQDPQSPAAGLLVGQLCKRAGLGDRAAAAYSAVARHDPQCAEAWSGLGRTLRDGAEFAGAEAAFERAGPQFMLDVGLARFHQGRNAEAIGAFEAILRRDPMDPEAGLALANARIAAGDFAAGWQAYDARFRIAGRSWSVPPAPPWRGEVMPDATLVIDAEQGFGDCLFAARFLREVRARVGKLILRCPPALAPVFLASALADAVVGADVRVAADAHAYMLSLPALLGITAPDDGRPYLRVPEALRAPWRERLAGDGLAVGLVWSGLASAPQNRYRAFDPAALAACLPDRARLYGLQLPQAGVPPCPQGVSDLAGALADFGQTAAALAALDLLVSAETSVAHLAGALGVTGWVLLPNTADWRWNIAGRENPWYGSLRTFRQATPMRWEDTFGAVRAALDDFKPGAMPAGA